MVVGRTVTSKPRDSGDSSSHHVAFKLLSNTFKRQDAKPLDCPITLGAPTSHLAIQSSKAPKRLVKPFKYSRLPSDPVRRPKPKTELVSKLELTIPQAGTIDVSSVGFHIIV